MKEKQERLDKLMKLCLESCNKKDDDEIKFYLELLVNNGLDITQDEEILSDSIRSGFSKDIIEFILQMFSKVSTECLSVAIRRLRWDIAGLLISRLNVQNSNIDEVFCLAIERKAPISIISWLYDLGASVDAKNGTPLVSSISNKDEETFDFLISNGVDVSIRDNKAIILAASNGNVHILNKLIKLNVDVSGNNNLAIINAFDHHVSLDAFRLLIEAGADVTVRENYILYGVVKQQNISWLNTLIETDKFTRIDFSLALDYLPIEEEINLEFLDLLFKQNLFKQNLTSLIKKVRKQIGFRRLSKNERILIKKLKKAEKAAEKF